MTSDEAIERLGEVVDAGTSGKFDNLEDAFNIAASALNYIMDNVEDQDDNEGS